jgi:hypothetical protein
MSLVGIAGRCGIMTSSLQELIAGHVGIGAAGKLGVLSSSLQTFVDGGTSLGLAGKMGITSSTLQELRNDIGKDGAIGLLIGLLCSD